MRGTRGGKKRGGSEKRSRPGSKVAEDEHVAVAFPCAALILSAFLAPAFAVYESLKVL